jgi:uncharacterized protein (TIGR00255 family)
MMNSKQTALRSMTGFAAAAAQQNGVTVTVSVRSVNHRYLDLRVHLPEVLLPLERSARSAIQALGPRGHVDVKAALDFTGGGDLAVDEALAARYVEVFQRLGKVHGLTAGLEAGTLAQLPGVVSRQGSSSSADVGEELGHAFSKALSDAIASWDKMRAEEASLLVVDMKARAAEITRATADVELWLKESLSAAQQKLVERLQSAVAPAIEASPGAQSVLDSTRLAQEALLLAERSDPTEEIERMKAHLKQFATLLEGAGDAGRKLDFLLQEMQRETNTLLAKVASLGASGLPLTNRGVEMKAEIEKLREQVQNIQ